MKRFGILVVAVTCALALSLAAQAKKKSDEGSGASEAKVSAGEKTYSNNDYRFELKYPGDWNANEQKMGGDADMEMKGINVPGMKMEMPRMLGVCFTDNNKCEPGKMGDDPSASLMVVDLAAAKRMAPKGKPGKTEKAEKADRPEHMDKPECETIERSNVKWGGASAPWMTVRCPEKKKWRYTTTVIMQHRNGKLQDSYTLMCSMRSKSKDKTESFTEYSDQLKPRCQKMVSTTKFRK